jgi:hypothetical protein
MPKDYLLMGALARYILKLREKISILIGKRLPQS